MYVFFKLSSFGTGFSVSEAVTEHKNLRLPSEFRHIQTADVMVMAVSGASVRFIGTIGLSGFERENHQRPNSKAPTGSGKHILYVWGNVSNL
jgi:hypothetical protein